MSALQTLMRYERALLFIAISILFIGPSLAFASTTNDQSNYEGDRITFAVDVKATVVSFDQKTLGDVFCLPAGTRVWGVGNFASDSKTGILFRTAKDKTITSCDASPKTIPKNSEILIENSNINPPSANRSGLTYGVLAVPFKFQVTGGKDFTGSATVGPYLGYRADPEGTLGFGISFVGFLGASNIAVQEPSASSGSTSSTTQNLAGFSWGFGLIGTVKGNFQLGGVLGFDRVSKNANYQYNGKPWIALELGYSFLQ
jgi:hypothetical protein